MSLGYTLRIRFVTLFEILRYFRDNLVLLCYQSVLSLRHSLRLSQQRLILSLSISLEFSLFECCFDFKDRSVILVIFFFNLLIFNLILFRLRNGHFFSLYTFKRNFCFRCEIMRLWVLLVCRKILLILWCELIIYLWSEHSCWLIFYDQ